MAFLGLGRPLGLTGAEPLEKDLLAHLPLTTDLLDHSPAKLPVKVGGRVELRDDGVWFDGGTNWLELPHLPLANRPFAFAVWLKVTGSNPMYGVLQQQQEDPWVNEWLHLMLRGGRQPYVGFYMNDAISPLPLPRNEWNHVVFQFTGKRQEIWINGRLICGRDSSAYQGKNGATLLGYSPRWCNVPCKDFHGYMRDARIYGRALNTAEVGAVLAALSPPGIALPSRMTARTVLKPASSFNALAADVGIPFLSIEGNRLVITGEASQRYELLYTDDLSQPWQPLTILSNPSGRVEFNDASAGSNPHRFYQVNVRKGGQ